jgi:hypothetical protein
MSYPSIAGDLGGGRRDEQGELAGERSCSRRRAPAVEETGAGCDGTVAIDRPVAERGGACPRRPELTPTTAPIGFDCQSFLTTVVIQFSDI